MRKYRQQGHYFLSSFVFTKFRFALIFPFKYEITNDSCLSITFYFLQYYGQEIMDNWSHGSFHSQFSKFHFLCDSCFSTLCICFLFLPWLHGAQLWSQVQDLSVCVCLYIAKLSSSQVQVQSN